MSKASDRHKELVLQRAQEGRKMTAFATANTRSATEGWLRNIGTRFVEVRLKTRDGWIDENHVADPHTLDETVLMSLERLHLRYAVWAEGDHWVLYQRQLAVAPGKTRRTYPTREAAEMVANHNV